MGEVYRARDTRLDRQVAIKVLPEDLAGSPEFRTRLEREARAASALNHPHICTLHDIGHQSGTDYLVMELIEGETLAARIDARPAAARGACLRLRHRDRRRAGSARTAPASSTAISSPGNVMIAKSGVKLLDFGLAHARPRRPGPARRAV